MSDTGEKKPKSNQNQTGMNVQSKEKQERVYKTELFLLQRWSGSYQQLMISANEVSSVQTGLTQDVLICFFSAYQDHQELLQNSRFSYNRQEDLP